MAGYTRTDTTNNIATGNIINASDLDNEYNAIDAAFTAATGHTHGGAAGEGAPITRVGPAQDLIVSNSAVTPKTDNALDLGSAALEFKDIYIDGTAYIDALDLNGTLVTSSAAELNILDGVLASTAEINFIDGVTSNIQTQLDAKQPLDAQLTDIAGLTPTDNAVIIGNGTNFVAESGATARASLGLAIGTDVQAYDADLTTLGAGGASARAFLGLVIGTDVQAYDAELAALSGLTPTDNAIIVGNGTTFVTESGATARTSLGLAIGTDVQAYDADLTTLGAGGSAARSFLGLAIGTDVQAYDAQLADVAGLTPTDNGVIIGNGTNFVVESGATLKTSLGLTVGTDVQAYDAQLADIAGLTPSDNAFIVGNGTNFVAESGATARTSLGLGTAATTASTDYATAAQGTKADTAFSWGNHASAGYVTSADPAGTAVALAIALG